MSTEVKENNPDIIDLTQAQDSGRPFLKNGEYCIRCLKTEFKKSKKGNPMIEFTWEIVGPESIQLPDGKTRKITGLQLMNWIVLNDMGFSRLKALHKAAQLDMKVNIKTPNVRQYLGKAIKAALTTDVQPVIDENTQQAQLDEQGNPVTRNNYEIVRFNAPDMEHTIPADNIAF